MEPCVRTMTAEPLPDLAGLRCAECGRPLDTDPHAALLVQRVPDSLHRDPPRGRRPRPNERVLHWICWQEQLARQRREQ
jgi:hypothetical protein